MLPVPLCAKVNGIWRNGACLIAALIGEEATDKLGGPVALDVMRPLQAYDAGGRARALSGIVAALAEAKAAGIDPGRALELVALADD